MFLLDTDHIGIIQIHNSPESTRLLDRIAAHPADAFHVSIISFHEQVLGWNAYIGNAREAAGVVRGYRMFERILTDFAVASVLPFDEQAAATFERLRSNRVRVPTMDLRIASISLSRNLVLLTRNVVDFRKIPELEVQDWTT